MKAKRMLIVILAIVLVATLVSAVACKKHTHQYTKWAYNDTQHWKVCPDDDEIDTTSYANHVFDQANGTKCVCGEEKAAPEVPCEHNYAGQPFVKDTANVGKHYQVCSKCGKPNASVACTSFTYSASKTAGKHTATCSDCGYKTEQDHAFTEADDKCVCGEEKPCEHDYTNQPFVKDTANVGKHYQVCSKCGEPSASVACTNFAYSASETEGKHTATCTDCGYAVQQDHAYTEADDKCVCGEEKPCEHDFTGQPYVADTEQKGKHYQLCKLCQEARNEGECYLSIISHTPSNHVVGCSLCTYEAAVAHDYTSGSKFNTCECGEVHEEYFICSDYTLGDETSPWAETTAVRERIFDDEGDGMHAIEFEFTQPCEFIIKKNLEGEWDSAIKYSTFDLEVYVDDEYEDLFSEGNDGRFCVKYACTVTIYISFEDEVIEIEVESVTPTAEVALSVPSGTVNVEWQAVIELPTYVFENKDIYIER